jgi:hypothetical protein
MLSPRLPLEVEISLIESAFVELDAAPMVEMEVKEVKMVELEFVCGEVKLSVLLVLLLLV